MESVCVTDTITGTSSFNPYKQPYGVGSPIVTTSDKGAEAQRGQLTCSESHSWLATELGLELELLVLAVLFVTHTLISLALACLSSLTLTCSPPGTPGQCHKAFPQAHHAVLCTFPLPDPLFPTQILLVL